MSGDIKDHAELQNFLRSKSPIVSQKAQLHPKSIDVRYKNNKSALEKALGKEIRISGMYKIDKFSDRVENLEFLTNFVNSQNEISNQGLKANKSKKRL